MTFREFDCAVCGGHFYTETDEATANRELLESGQQVDGDSELLAACDSCYQIVMARARELGALNPPST